MGQTKKPRKAYRPRVINRAAHIITVMGVAWLDDGEIQHRARIINAAVDACCQGAGEPKHWRALFESRLDLQYFNSASLIGIRHSQIGLDPKW